MNRIAASITTRPRFHNLPNDRSKRANPLYAAKGQEIARSSRPRWEEQRQSLLDLRARLVGDVEQNDDSLGSSVTLASASPDAVDCATEVVEQNLAVSLLGSAIDVLEHVDAALERIRDGVYGRCDDCHGHIPAARLQAIPYAIHCVGCATKHERDRQ